MSSGIFKIQTHKVPCQYIREYPRAIVDQEGDLYLHVKQYTPQDDFHSRPNAITIIGAHANGFPKVCLGVFAEWTKCLNDIS